MPRRCCDGTGVTGASRTACTGARDVTMGEDANRTRVGSDPQVLAALRNAAISHLGTMGSTNIAASLRRHAACVGDLLKVLYNVKN